MVVEIFSYHLFKIYLKYFKTAVLDWTVIQPVVQDVTTSEQ